MKIRLWSVALVVGLSTLAVQAAMTPGAGLRTGNLRISPFLEWSAGYDSNVRLDEGEVLPLNPDGSYTVQETKVGDFFSQLTVGAGLSRAIESELDLRLRAWYDTRLYSKYSDINYDSVTVEGSGRYWPVSDKYAVSAGGKFRQAQDTERVPPSASMTMPGDTSLPYLEERSDRLKRQSMDAYVNADLLALDRTDFSLGGTVNSENYTDKQLFDYWHWQVNGTAGYRFSEKTFVFGEMEYQMVQGDALSKDVPVYAWRLGFRTKPREKIDYRVSLGVKTYEHAQDPEGASWKRTWGVDFDGFLNWRYSEKLNVFGKAWTDVSTAINETDDTRRTYAGQVGANYAFMKRLSAVGALSYRLDDYDFPIVYGKDLVQNQTQLWQAMGRLVLSPRANTFWKAYLETSYEFGDNDLDTYDQWLVWAGVSLWY